MSLEMIPCAYPLAWPVNEPRTPWPRTKRGRFGKSSRGYHNRDITIREALVRVAEQIHAFTGNAAYYVINPADCELRTDMLTRLDGQFRSGQKTPDDWGAVLTFPWSGRDCTIAIDTYERIEHNIAAIAACLESLRALDRHGGNILDKAMAGYAALPAPATRRHWRDVFGGTESNDLAVLKVVYRQLSKRYHPDTGTDASDSRMADLNLAWADAKAELGQ